MRTRIVAVTGLVVAALAAVMVTGCADGANGPDASPSPPDGTVTSPASPSPGPESPRPSPTPSPSAAPPGGGSPAPPPASKPAPTVTGGRITVTGTVTEGVEAGCLLLQTDTGEYLLVLSSGVDREAVRAGSTVTVRGRVQPDLMTICQQGTPFVVTEVVRG